MFTVLPDLVETTQVSYSELAARNLAAVSRELNEYACAILHQDEDSLVFRAPARSLGQRMFRWTRSIYRIHCAGAQVYLSPKGEYHAIAHGSREAVMREVHALLQS